MTDFWYDFVKPKYGKKSTVVLYGHSFILYIKTGDTHKDIAEDVETRFNTSIMN